MKNQKSEHICITVFKDGHCYGATEPLWKSEAFDMYEEAMTNGIDAFVVDLTNLFKDYKNFLFKGDD